MIYELVYTSLPRGLKPGSKGYCTVLTTEGIPSSLQERLEGFSGYRHLFDPGSPQNPVNFMHHRIQIAGNTWHVLSRVADAGSDYSQRSNLFAHHVAISNDELAGIACGPSTLMKHPGFFMTQWEGDPRRVSEAQTRQRLSQLSNNLRVAALWQRLTGNAGFAGVLAKTASDDSSHATSLVYPLGIDILELIDEAMVLLPKHLQWQTTFNSFFTKSIEDCAWRFYCDVAAESRAFSGSAFDLTTLAESEIAIDETEPLVIAAKTGKAASTTITPSAAKTTFEPASGRPKLQPRVKKEEEIDISKLAKSELREKGKYVDPAFNRSQKSSPPATPQPLKPNHLPIHSVDPYQIIEDSHSRQATLPPLSGNLKNKAPKSKKKSVELNFLPLLSVPIVLIFLLAYFFVIPMLWKQKSSTISVAEQQTERNHEKTDPVNKVLEPVSKPENKDEGKQEKSAKEKPEDKDKAQLAKKTEETKLTQTSINKELANNGTGETPATALATAPATTPATVTAPATEKPVAAKAETKKLSGHATAEYYQPDKSVIIVDLYSELKKIRDQKDSRTKSITIKLPEGVELKKDEMLLNYILFNKKIEPATQLKMESTDEKSRTIVLNVPEEIQKMKDDELLSACFATITWKNQKDDICNIQFIKPVKVEKMVTKPRSNGKSNDWKIEFYLSYNEIIDQVHNNRKSETFISPIEFICHSPFIGFDTKFENKKGPYISLIPKSAEFEENISRLKPKPSDKITISVIDRCQLYYPYTFNEIPGTVIGANDTEFNKRNNQYKYNTVTTNLDVYIKQLKIEQMKYWSSEFTPILCKTPTIQDPTPTMYYLIKDAVSHKIAVYNAESINSLVKIWYSNEPAYNQIDEWFKNESQKNKIRNVINDSKTYFPNMIKICNEISMAITRELNKIPPISFELSFDKQKNPQDHWWILQENGQSKKISENKLNSLNKSRLIFAEFTEQE